MGRFFCLLMVMAALFPLAVRTQASGPAMTQVVDTVYRADGSAGDGHGADFVAGASPRSTARQWPPVR